MAKIQHTSRKKHVVQLFTIKKKKKEKKGEKKKYNV